MSTFVSVGNAHHPFPRLLDAVARIAADLPQPVIVQHGHTPFVSEACLAISFMEVSEYERAIASAAVVIGQAGGGGVLQALKSGKTPVIVSRLQELGEIVDNHQVSWGQALASTQRVVLVEDVADLMAGVRKALQQQSTHKAEPREIVLIDMVTEALEKSDGA